MKYFPKKLIFPPIINSYLRLYLWSFIIFYAKGIKILWLKPDPSLLFHSFLQIQPSSCQLKILGLIALWINRKIFIWSHLSKKYQKQKPLKGANFYPIIKLLLNPNMQARDLKRKLMVKDSLVIKILPFRSHQKKKVKNRRDKLW